MHRAVIASALLLLMLAIPAASSDPDNGALMIKDVQLPPGLIKVGDIFSVDVVVEFKGLVKVRGDIRLGIETSQGLKPDKNAIKLDEIRPGESYLRFRLKATRPGIQKLRLSLTYKLEGMSEYRSLMTDWYELKIAHAVPVDVAIASASFDWHNETHVRLRVRLINDGYSSATNLLLSWYVNGELVDSLAIESIPPWIYRGAAREFELFWRPPEGKGIYLFRVNVTSLDDPDPSDNVWELIFRIGEPGELIGVQEFKISPSEIPPARAEECNITALIRIHTIGDPEAKVSVIGDGRVILSNASADLRHVAGTLWRADMNGTCAAGRGEAEVMVAFGDNAVYRKVVEVMIPYPSGVKAGEGKAVTEGEAWWTNATSEGSEGGSAAEVATGPEFIIASIRRFLGLEGSRAITGSETIDRMLPLIIAASLGLVVGYLIGRRRRW